LRQKPPPLKIEGLKWNGRSTFVAAVYQTPFLALHVAMARGNEMSEEVKRKGMTFLLFLGHREMTGCG
jgi:hypothetical protein